MNLGIKGKNALITGGSHGIGRAIALALAEEGCNIAICARKKGPIKQTVAEIKSKGVDSIGISTEVLIKSDIDRTIKTIIDEWKTIHILINSVGGGGRWGSDEIEKTDESIWIDVYNKNTLSAIRFTMKVLPFMRKQKWGRVIAIASIGGLEASGRPWFHIAKSAEIMLMKSLARRFDIVRDGITFNSVAPGSIMIPDTGWEAEENKDPKAFKKMLDSQFPLKRLGTPEEIANPVVFLCSEKASLINGSCVVVDGGESKCL